MREKVFIVRLNLRKRYSASRACLDTALRAALDAGARFGRIIPGALDKVLRPLPAQHSLSVLPSVLLLSLLAGCLLWPGKTYAEPGNRHADSLTAQDGTPITGSQETMAVADAIMPDPSLAVVPYGRTDTTLAPATQRPAEYSATGIDDWRADSRPADGVTTSDGSPALGLLEAGEKAFDRGDRTQAQQLFEMLISTAPASREAETARQRLGQIYRGEGLTTTATGAGGVVVSDATASTRSRNANKGGNDPGLGTSVSIRSPKPWRADARRSYPVEQLLRTAVGDRIFFAPASTAIGTRAKTVLRNQAAWLSKYEDIYVIIEGHADEPTDEETNTRISQDRAIAARNLLVATGFPADRIDISVRGRQERVATCSDPGCQAQNRRAVMRVMLVLPKARRTSRKVSGVKNVFSGSISDADRQHVSGNLPPQR